MAASDVKNSLKSIQEAKVVNDAFLRGVVALLENTEATAINIEDCLLKLNRMLISSPSPKVVEMIVASELPTSIVRVIRRHQGHPPAVAFACQVLANCAGTTEVAPALLRAGVLEEALAMMDRYKMHGGVQNTALFLLRALFKDGAAARQGVANGAIPRVLAALALSMGREVQHSGMVALRHMAETGRNRWQENLKEARASIQEAALHTKVTHQSDEALCQAADGVLALVTPRFKEVMCWHWQSGWCKMGPKCTYAHGTSDLRGCGRGTGKGVKGTFGRSAIPVA